MIAFPKQIIGLECPGVKYERRECQRRVQAELDPLVNRRQGLTEDLDMKCMSF